MADTGKAVKVRMLFFGPLAERIGEREIEVALKFGTTAEQLINRFELSEYLDSGLRVAIDGQIGASLDAPLADSSEVAFLPPVSGG
ncbi:MAG TPA: MoaD/ThiS family protein [Candidatus Poseidoniales archaeon]|nr:MAG: molybdopterin synthase sulfur carrier subunit [Euryarchaeota archaeon]HIG38441.1 MoaD/ThiS family protein [Candidatus Poseidoniales archaeon]HIL43746.1 MoaD/ThiS family protein [Candidatus Poseidoniales archaeon]